MLRLLPNSPAPVYPAGPANSFEMLEWLADIAECEVEFQDDRHWTISGPLEVTYDPLEETVFVTGSKEPRRVENLVQAVSAAWTPPPVTEDRDTRGGKKLRLERLRACWVERGERSCAWCGLPFENMDQASIDHVIPLARGGAAGAENCCLSCHECNEARGHEMPELSQWSPTRRTEVMAWWI